MSKSRELTFETVLSLTCAGATVEYTAKVKGVYHPYVPAYYGGEMAAIDPPEPALFEVSTCVVRTKNGFHFDFWFLLDEAAQAAIELEGVTEAER